MNPDETFTSSPYSSFNGIIFELVTVIVKSKLSILSSIKSVALIRNLIVYEIYGIPSNIYAFLS
jgi:hypothetical protein